MGCDSVIYRLRVGTVVEKTKSWSCMTQRTAIAQFVAGVTLTGKEVSIRVHSWGVKITSSPSPPTFPS